MRAGKAGAIASGKNGGIAGAAMIVDNDAVLRGQSRGLGQSVVWNGADADDDQIGCNDCSRPGFDREPAIRQVAQADNGGAEPDLDLVRAVARVHESGRLLVADTRKEARGNLDYRGAHAEFRGR